MITEWDFYFILPEKKHSHHSMYELFHYVKTTFKLLSKYLQLNLLYFLFQ